MAERRRDVFPTYKGARAALFLFRQPFLYWPATAAGIVSAFWLLTLAMRHGTSSPKTLFMLVLMGPVMGFGFAVLTALPGFMVWRWLRAPVRTLEPEAGEAQLLARTANHWLGDEARGGKLFLTTRGLVFVPHRFNVQLAVTRVPWSTVTGAEWLRVVTPQGRQLATVLIVRTGGREEWYVVPHADKLAELAEALAPLDEAARAATGLDLARQHGLAPPA